MTQEEYAAMLDQARSQFKEGKPLFGKEGAFHRVLEVEGEIDSHIESTKPSTGNRRNGKLRKEVQTEACI